MAKKKRIDVSDIGVNPFVCALVIDVTKVIENKPNGVNEYYVDRDSHTKVYRTIQGRDIAMMMTSVGSKLYAYIQHHLEPGEDVINISPVSFLADSGLKSNKSYYSAVIELQRLGVINPVAGKKCMYFINPAILFCGSRIDKYPDNVVIKGTFRKK